MKQAVRRNIVIERIALCASPAQDAATIVMAKAQFTADQRKQLADSGAALPDGSYPIRNEADLKNALQSIGRATNRSEVVAHIAKRARALGLESALKESSVFAKTKHQGGTPDEACADCGKPVAGGVCTGCGKAADATKAVSKTAASVRPTSGNGAGAASGDRIVKTVEELTAENEALAKARDVALRRAGMTDAEKAHEATLPEADRAAFVAQEPAARLDAVAKAKAADAVIYKSKRTGREYTRSTNSEIVALAKDADAAYELAANEAATRKDGEYLAKAKALNHLAGTDEEKVVLLKAIDAIPDATARAKQHELLTSRNTEMAKAFARAGAINAEPVAGSAEQKIEAGAATLAKAQNLTPSVAKSRFLGTPEGKRLYAEYEQERERLVRNA